MESCTNTNKQNVKQCNNTGSRHTARKWVYWMNQRTKSGVVVVVCALLFPQIAAAEMGMMYMSDPRNIKGANMAMHHLHIVMNHGMAMATEGVSMVITAQASVGSEIDSVALRHGEQMVNKGKSSIQNILKSQTMRKLHLSEHEGDALMLYTHKLGVAMQAFIQLSRAMVKTSDRDKDALILSQIRLMLTRALKLSVEGSSLVMFGQMDMVRGTDKTAIKHGRSMMALAHALWRDAAQGKAMETLHPHGADTNASMKYTHRYASAAKKVMDMLDDMSKVIAAKNDFRSSYNSY